MDNKLKYAIIVVLVGILVGAGAYVALTQNQNSTPSNPPPSGSPGGNSTYPENIEAVKAHIYSLPYQNLSAQEKQGLLYMREEEKLARDVYLYAYNMWGLKIFNQIAQSEQFHTNIVGILIEKYNLTDPYVSTPGVFKNQTIQKLYYNLTARVNQSSTEALIVGANIEELDIVDIQHWLDRTDNQDIKYAYNLLINGSANHLRAFVKNLANRGVTYHPVYLSQEEYEKIINS